MINWGSIWVLILFNLAIIWKIFTAMYPEIKFKFYILGIKIVNMKLFKNNKIIKDLINKKYQKEKQTIHNILKLRKYVNII